MRKPRQPTGQEVCNWLANELVVTEGPLAGEPFNVMPFQRRFVYGMLRSKTSVMSMARGNGKTTFSSALATATLIGPLLTPRGSSILVAASSNQARIAFKYVRDFFTQRVPPEMIGRGTNKRYAIIDNTHHREIRDNQTHSELRVLGSDPDVAHGLAPRFVLGDEPAKWKHQQGARMYSALRTAKGKQTDTNMLLLGTKPEDINHWFSILLSRKPSPSEYIQKHAASANDGIFTLRAIRKANPGFNYLPALRAELLEERDEARAHGGDKLAQWLALRLNMGTSEVADRQMICEHADWSACQVDDLPDRLGPAFIGIDLGGSASMTAAAVYWPQSGRLELYCAFPAKPGLAERGQR